MRFDEIFHFKSKIIKKNITKKKNNVHSFNLKLILLTTNC